MSDFTMDALNNFTREDMIPSWMREERYDLCEYADLRSAVFKSRRKSFLEIANQYFFIINSYLF